MTAIFRRQVMKRQGDVLLVRVGNLPADAVLKEDPIVARGELTGHTHRVIGPVQVFQSAQDLFVKGEGKLVHEEHDLLSFEEGVYKVVRQREYNPTANRQVQD